MNNSTVIATQPASIVSDANAVFPRIELGVAFTPKTSVRRNWKAFFDQLPIGGSFILPNENECTIYYINARRHKVYLRRKKQPGGTYRVWRVQPMN